MRRFRDGCTELRSCRPGGEAITVSLDVTDEASTIAAFDAAEAAFDSRRGARQIGRFLMEKRDLDVALL